MSKYVKVKDIQKLLIERRGIYEKLYEDEKRRWKDCRKDYQGEELIEHRKVCVGSMQRLNKLVCEYDDLIGTIQRLYDTEAKFPWEEP